jgi:threonine-phosphate decarboxylase
MRSILDACKEHGIFVMIDETYVEFAEDVERVTAVPLTKYYDNLIILRGTSKFFAAPGLRLGYAITGNRDLLKNLGTRQNPWSISSLAAIAGEIMFTDQEYIEKTRALISSERKRMYDMLSAHPDYKVYEPSANFLLVKLLREDQTSDSLFDKAIRRCMMIRDCSTFPFLDDRYIRFCIMSPEMNDKLMACILE